MFKSLGFKMFHFIFLLIFTVTKLPPSLAISSNIYHELSTLNYFIDKTELLRILFDETSSSNHSYYYINAPTRFGKTVNLEMIHTFAGINLDESGNIKPPKDTISYELFRRLKISNYTTVMENHLARYPVIHMDLFGICATETSPKQFLSDMNTVLWYELDQFPKLKDLAEYPNPYNITESEISFMSSIKRKNLTTEQITRSISTLAKILYQYFNHTKVILLIDEYDTTAYDSVHTPNLFTVPIYEDINKMILNALVSAGAYLKMAVITGVTSLTFAMEEKFLDIISHNAFLDEHQFYPYYGFSEHELQLIIDRYECNETESSEIRAYYRPYYTSINRIPVYNTYCISEYFKYRGTNPDKPDLFKRYWTEAADVGRTTYFLRNPIYRASVIRLLVKNVIYIRFKKLFAPDALEEFIKLREREYRGIEHRHITMFYKYTFEIGYLTHTPGNESFSLPNYDAKQAVEEDLNYYHELYPKNCSTCDCKIKCPTTP